MGGFDAAVALIALDFSATILVSATLLSFTSTCCKKKNPAEVRCEQQRRSTGTETGTNTSTIRDSKDVSHRMTSKNIEELSPEDQAEVQHRLENIKKVTEGSFGLTKEQEDLLRQELAAIRAAEAQDVAANVENIKTIFRGVTKYQEEMIQMELAAIQRANPEKREARGKQDETKAFRITAMNPRGNDIQDYEQYMPNIPPEKPNAASANAPMKEAVFLCMPVAESSKINSTYLN